MSLGARRWYLQACPLAGPLFLLIPGQILLASKGAHTEKCWAVHSVGAGGIGQGFGPFWTKPLVTSCGFAKPRPSLPHRAQSGAGASMLQVWAALRPIWGAGAGGAGPWPWPGALAGSRAAPTLAPLFPCLLPAQLPTKVAASFLRATMLVGCYPEGYPWHGVAQSWRDRLSRSRGCGQKAFITMWIQTPRCVDRLDHHDAGDRLPLPAKLLRASPRRKLGNRLMKRVIWGVLYKPKEMYT